MARRVIVLIILPFACSTAAAQYEGCHFEMVTHNVTVLETISAGELFQGGTPNQAAMDELTDELSEMLGNTPAAGYYQIRYYVAALIPGARTPLTTCLEIGEGESVEDAVGGDTPNIISGGGSGEGIAPWEPPTIDIYGDFTVCGGGPSYSIVEPFKTTIVCGHAPGGGGDGF